MNDNKIPQSLFGPRVRFAPSPTGWMHLGNVRTALFNFLFARHHSGTFILRIEDTDQVRFHEKYEKSIIKGLKWLNIHPDEGPEVGGECGPYRQSERKNIYQQYINQLLNENKAYYCFCSLEELEIQRQEMISRGIAPKYSGKCLSLTKEEIDNNFLAKKPSVIRFHMPKEIVQITDLIKGELKFDLSLTGDIIIAKSLEEPLYNFAVVIDDYLMKISHVIRGEDHISNTPKQIMIQEAFGFPRPQYAHLPMLLGPDRSKLSKRHGAMAVSSYKKMGYLSEAMINFISLLGWHPSGDKEIFSLNELISQFSLERIQKSGAIFNIQKLNWFNSHYLKLKSLDSLALKVFKYLKKRTILDDTINENNLEMIKKILEIELPRINKLEDLITSSDFFFKKDLNYLPELLIWKNMNNEELINSLKNSLSVIQDINESVFNKVYLQTIFTEIISKNSDYVLDRGKILWPLRVALSGKQSSPGPFEIAEVLGKKETVNRLKKALQIINN